METKCHSSVSVSEFNRPNQANQDTNWFSDPANPTQSFKGTIQQGETVWFHEDLYGSGPAWQQVRLADQTLVYVNPHHFETLRQEQMK